MNEDNEESLINTFSSNEFNTKSWINQLLNNSITNNNNNNNNNNNSNNTNNINSLIDQNNIKIENDIENILSSSLSKLQLYQIELNISLENITSESLLIVPKSIREVDRIRKESIQLKNKIKSVSNKIETMSNKTVNTESKETVSQIEKLDLVKQRMEISIRSLKEAEKLLSFSKQVDQLFSSNDYLMISDKLEDVKQSLSVLSDVPEFREQSKKFNIYQDRLEQQLKPILEQSFISRDLDACKKYLKIFQNIQRKDKFFSYYNQVRIDPLKILWYQYNGSGTSSNFNNWLSKFYDEVLIMINSEYNWLSDLCPLDYVQILESLIVSLFTSLVNQNVASRIDAAIANQNNNNGPIKINELLTIYKTTCLFIKSLSPIFPNILVSSKIGSGSNVGKGSGSGSGSLDHLKLFKVILEPYKYFQNKFSEYEIKSLKSQLATVLPTIGNNNRKQGDFGTIIKNVETQLIPKLFQMAQQSIERFFDFTHTTDIDSYITIVQNQLFTEFSNILNDTINELKFISGLSTNYIIGSNGQFPNFTNIGGTTTTLTSGTSGNTTASGSVTNISSPPISKELNSIKGHSRSSSTGKDLPATAATLQNWEYFQGAMNLLQSVHNLLIKFQQFDNSLHLGIIHYLSNENGDQFTSNIRNLILGSDLTKLQKLQQSIHILENKVSTSNGGSGNGSGGNIIMLNESFNKISRVVSVVQHFVYETMIYFIKTKLKELPKIVSNEWNNNNTSGGIVSSGLSYISQITDHLLTIPQQLDPYSEEELTRFSLATSISYPIKTNSQIENEFFQNLIIQYQKEKQQDGELLKSGGNEDGDEDDDDDQFEGIAHQWITIVAKSTEKLYLQTIVEIITLSEQSCNQLSNDISYLFNVLSALGVSPESLLLKTQQLLEMNRESFTNYYHQLQQTNQQQQLLSNAEKNICNLIAKMRNIR